MEIKIRLMGHDLPVAMYSPLQLPDESTIESALDSYLKSNNVSPDLSELKKSQFIVNRVHCSVHHVLKGGDELTVIRYLGGG